MKKTNPVLIIPGLKTLEQHNKDVTKRDRDARKARPNGIKCPKCEEELCDTRPLTQFQNSIGRYTQVNCSKCGWKGDRLV